MKFTGERYVPSVSGDIELEHTHRYLIAAEFVSGKEVLDIASGEGYGSALLARHAAHVIGVDIDQFSVEHARQSYSSPNLEFHQGDCSSIPLPDACVDVVVSFETIEHHSAHDEMMREVKRVLRPGGLLIISSPDKAEYSDVPGTTNEFHVRELYRGEFEDLLARYFAHFKIQGQRVVYGSLLAGDGDSGEPFLSYRNDEGQAKRSKGTLNAVYLLAFASDFILPATPNSAYSTLSPSYFQDVYQLQLALKKRVELVDHLVARIELAASAFIDQHTDSQGLDSPLPDVIDGTAISPRLAGSLSVLREQIKATNKIVTQNRINEDRVLKLASQLDALDQDIASERELHSGLEHQVRSLEQTMQQMLRSNSWRLTSPFRVCANLARAGVRLVREFLTSSRRR